MEKLITIINKEEVLDLIEYIKDKDYISFDTETTGVTDESEIIGYSICAESNVAYYVVTKYWDKEKNRLVSFELDEESIQLMRVLNAKFLIMHNGLFDIVMVRRNYGVDLTEAFHTDTMILAHLLDENRRVGLKELGSAIYGAEAKKEQEEMAASVSANGGELTKKNYELYKGDCALIAKYGAKDAILTYNLFYEFLPELYEEGLDRFFYEDESMPLLKGPTQSLNTVGLKIDIDKLTSLKKSLEIEIMEAEEFIYREIKEHIAQEYPGTTKKTQFNLGSVNQVSWLLYSKLGHLFHRLSDSGREICPALGIRVPYNNSDKRIFMETLKAHKGQEWRKKGEVWDKKAKKYKGSAKVKDYWTYISVDAQALTQLSGKYKWISRLLDMKKAQKLLNNYVEGIEAEVKYGVIKPNFLQHGTTSGRYSCRKPNFQNLPREDKRVKACVVSRPGKVFVGADYSQLEPRVFASFSKDERLLKCFSDGDDFYSVVGAPIFLVTDCTLKKDDSPTSFAVKHKKLRDISKIIALATPYGTCAPQMASEIRNKTGLEKDIKECQGIINDYFSTYPRVEKLMLDAHEQVKKHGVVYNLFGRPRRIPAAKQIVSTYGTLRHSELPGEARNLLNLAMNHPIQSTGASIMNRAAIAFYSSVKLMESLDIRWKEVNIVLQVHDELVVECPEYLGEEVSIILKEAMENTVELPGVKLIAEPKIAKNLADLK